MSIFGEQAGLKKREVSFKGGKVTVHEILDEDYFECVALPAQDLEAPDEDDKEGILRYNRNFNLRLMAASLRPSLNMDAEAIIEALKKESKKAMDKLMEAVLEVNAMEQEKKLPDHHFRMRLAMAMGCYSPPSLPMSELMKWWNYHQAEPGAFPGNRYPKPRKSKKHSPQTMDEQLSILKGLTR